VNLKEARKTRVLTHLVVVRKLQVGNGDVPTRRVQLARHLAPDAARAAGHKGGGYGVLALLTFDDVAMPASMHRISEY
jgi:hypothetical protein